MVELIERRVTRSLSNELQNRGQGHHPAHQQPLPPSVRGKPQVDICNGLQPKLGHPGYLASEQLRTTSEEILIRTLVDGSITQSSPSMDCLGFASLPPTYRKDSEELFNAWLNIDGHGEIASSQCGWQQARGSCDKSMDISQEHRGSGHQVDGGQQDNLMASSLCPQAPLMGKDANGGLFSLTPNLGNLQTLSGSQNGRPVTRSRSAELRQKYAAMQGLSPLPPSLQAAHNIITWGGHGGSRALASGGGGNVTYNELQPLDAFRANLPGPSISNMVSMLKKSLECRRPAHQIKHQHQGACEQAEPLGQLGQIHPEEEARNQSRMGHVAIRSPRVASIEEASPCISSGGALTLSTGAKLISNVPPSYSVTPLSMSQNSLKWTSHSTGVVEQPYEKISHGGINCSPHVSSGGEGSLKGFPSVGKKPQQLTRAGSLISSARSGVATDGMSPTKMRRVERREKMLESKGTPVVPSDLKVALKRCDALEKEVRSLKLNLSFMNRKDSEQTKRIEELEKENHELQHEKGRLLKEVERLASSNPY